MNINLNGIQWHYTSNDAFDWFAKIGSTPQVVVIKAASHHSVYRHAAGVYIKIFQYPFYRAFRSQHSAKACKDGKNALLLQQIGIVTPKVLAFGEDRRCIHLKRDVLITMELSGLQPLPEFIKNTTPGLSPRQNQNLIEKFSIFVKKLHESGVYHRDINFGNLFIEHHEGDYRFVLLDLDKVRSYSKPISTAKRIRNLGDLLQMFWLLTRVSHRLYFLNGYGWQKEKQKHFLKHIEKHVHGANFKRGKALYRKSLSSRSGFICESLDHIVVHRLNESQAKEAMEDLLPKLAAIRKSQLPGCAGEKYPTEKTILDGKHYLLTQFPSEKRSCFPFKTPGNTTATDTWRMAWGGFASRMIPIVKPLLLLKAKPDAVQQLSYILYEWHEQVVGLNRFWQGLSSTKKDTMLIRLGFFIGHMHRCGCTHGNLSWENILVDTQGKDPQLLLFHIENGKIHRRLSSKAALKDLFMFADQMKKLEPSPASWDIFRKSYEKRSGQIVTVDIQHTPFPQPDQSRI